MSRKKIKQGEPLPAAGTPLRDFPVGACVLLPGGWHMVVYRIGGGRNPPHCREMVRHPGGLDWQDGMSRLPAREVDGDTPVSESCWPRRRSEDKDEDENGERDPLVLGLKRAAAADQGSQTSLPGD